MLRVRRAGLGIYSVAPVKPKIREKKVPDMKEQRRYHKKRFRFISPLIHGRSATVSAPVNKPGNTDQ